MNTRLTRRAVVATGLASPAATPSLAAGYPRKRTGDKSFTDMIRLKLLSVAGIDISKVKKVPFGGAGPAMVALASGRINLSGGAIGTATALIASGDGRK